MAQKRMFNLSIVDSDAFLDMPCSAQSLYFHLSMRADDEGFVNKPKAIQRLVGAEKDDLQCLIDNRFLIAFDSGVVAIKHWRVHNALRDDRIIPTLYTHEKSELAVKENGSYTERDGYQGEPCGYQGEPNETSASTCENVNPPQSAVNPPQSAVNPPQSAVNPPQSAAKCGQMSGQIRLGKDRLGESSVVSQSTSLAVVSGTKGIRGDNTTPISQNSTNVEYPDVEYAYPSEEECRAYWQCSGYVGDYEDFYLHYQSIGWVDGGGKPIDDWKAALRKWAKNQCVFDQDRRDQGKKTVAEIRREQGKSTWKTAQSMSDDEFAQLDRKFGGA